MANEARQSNPHEAAARAEKVRKLSEEIDRQHRLNQTVTLRQVADFLAGLSEHQRVTFAASVGVKRPSDTTWTAVVAIYVARADEYDDTKRVAATMKPSGFGDGRSLAMVHDAIGGRP